jgi:hypothetical protein
VEPLLPGRVPDHQADGLLADVEALIEVGGLDRRLLVSAEGLLHVTQAQARLAHAAFAEQHNLKRRRRHYIGVDTNG